MVTKLIIGICICSFALECSAICSLFGEWICMHVINTDIRSRWVLGSFEPQGSVGTIGTVVHVLLISCVFIFGTCFCMIWTFVECVKFRVT